jgi:hypothetical protein
LNHHAVNFETKALPRFIQGAVFLCLVLAVFLVAGCGGRESSDTLPPRDTLKSQVVFDLFDALEAENVKVALASIDRLRGFTNETEFLDLIEQRERNRWLTERTRIFLEKGEYGTAVDFVERYMQHEGVSNFADRLRGQLVALNEIVEYRRNYPFASATDAEDRLSLLRRNVHAINDHQQVQDWLKRQSQLVQDQRLLEQEKDVSFLLFAADRHTVNGRFEEAHLVVSQLALQLPRHPLVMLRQAMASGDYEALRRTIVEHRRDTTFNRNIEIAAALCWEQLQDYRPFLTAMYKYLRFWPPASLSGVRLRIQLAFMKGQTALAVRQVRQLREWGTQLDRRLIGRLMGDSILSREQFQARPWRAPFPTVTDVLNRIAQIREFQGTKPDSTESD